MIMNKSVTIIIITWNALHFLKVCLRSVYEKNTSTEFEIILIDNNSSDGTEEFVRNAYPQIKYYKNKENKGVAPARNQGLKLSNSDYCLILDVDTEFITENALNELMGYMSKRPEVGLIGAQLISSDGEIQNSCLEFPSLWVKMFVRFERFTFIKNTQMLKSYYMLDYNKQTEKEVDYVIGAFQFIRREMLEKVGLYDEKIFYGPEDIDFCLRGKRAGFKTVYYPAVKLNHFYQRITKKVFSKITFKHIKGLIYFFWKHKYINYPK